MSIVLGYSGKVHELINVEAAAADKVPLVRRYTGGGTVVVDPSTGGSIFGSRRHYRHHHLPVSLPISSCSVFTTFIMNDTDVPSKPFPRDIMAWSEEDVFRPMFRAAGLDQAGSEVHPYT